MSAWGEGWLTILEPIIFGDTHVNDQQIIEKHAEGQRGRARMELQIVRRVIRNLHAAGFKLREREDNRVLGERELIELLFDLDEAYVDAYKNGRRTGWVRFVFGNDGWDVLSDYSLGIEKTLTATLGLIDEMERNR